MSLTDYYDEHSDASPTSFTDYKERIISNWYIILPFFAAIILQILQTTGIINLQPIPIGKNMAIFGIVIFISAIAPFGLSIFEHRTRKFIANNFQMPFIYDYHQIKGTNWIAIRKGINAVAFIGNHDNTAVFMHKYHIKNNGKCLTLPANVEKIEYKDLPETCRAYVRKMEIKPPYYIEIPGTYFDISEISKEFIIKLIDTQEKMNNALWEKVQDKFRRQEETAHAQSKTRLAAKGDILEKLTRDE